MVAASEPTTPGQSPAESLDVLLAELPALFEKGNRGPVGFATIAIENIGDPSAAPRLQALLPTAPDWALYWLTRAIRRLTGHHPAPPENLRDYAVIRETWQRLDLTTPPEPAVTWSRATASRVEATVANGRALFALAPDDTGGQGGWPEWDYSWQHADERLYRVGNICDTCEPWLVHVGWSPKEAADLAQAVRDAVTDVQALDDSTMTALEPLLCTLASSRYQARLIDLPLVATTVEDVAVYAPPHPTEPTHLMIAPTQRPDLDLNPSSVAAYEAAIARGERPALIVAAYVSQITTYDYDADVERTPLSARGFIIDGHHKLAAYLNQQLPPRIILICDRTPPLPTAPDPIGVLDALITEAGGGDVI